MVNSTDPSATTAVELSFFFHWDRDFGIDLVHSFHFYYCVIAIITIHPLVLYLLIWESKSLSKEIRFGYIANQIKSSIHQAMLQTILAFGVIIPGPPFEYLLLMMHQKLVYNTPSKFRLSKAAQYVIIAAITLLLVANVVGFGLFGRRTKKADEILNRPELAWLTSKGGEVLLFGDIADPEHFVFENFIFAVSVILIFSFVSFFSWHTIKVIDSTKGAFTDETVRLQIRMINVLRYQFYGVFICYALPCAFFLLGIQFGTLGIPNQRYVARSRWLFTMLHILDAVPQSLIFLLKNQTYRRIVIEKVRRLLLRLIPFIDRSVAPTNTPIAPFSSFQSNSVTRPNEKTIMDQLLDLVVELSGVTRPFAQGIKR